jgi:isopentenyl-diphosphate Delta-isomerase
VDKLRKFAAGMQRTEEVVLVDTQDRPTGVMEKMEAHRRGLLHRAFSVFIFNGRGEMLLQKRAQAKYHSPGLWSNACCSHPRPGEDVHAAAMRRLREETGLTTALHRKTSFIYRTEFANGLTEHEFDHVFTGVTDEQPTLNVEEASDYRWLAPELIRREIADDESRFTSWFVIAMRDVFKDPVIP